MLTNKEKMRLKDYEEQMAMPKWKHILISGVLAWGVPVAILVSLVTPLVDGISFGRMLRRDLWINLIGFPIGGIFVGLYMRWFFPRQIKKLRTKESLPG